MFHLLKDRLRAGWKPSTFTESKEDIINPGRGWYRIYTFRLWENVNREEMMVVCAKEESLALVLVDIGHYREKEIDEKGLNNLKDILLFFQEVEKDMIVRIVYDTEGRGLEQEPSSLERIKTHIKQVGPILSKYSTSIFTFQGLLLGSWGEMHGSKFLSKSCLVTLFETFYKATNGSIPIAVRSPKYRRMILGEERENKDGHEEINRLSFMVGLYNDAIMGSNTDLGTYQDVGDGVPLWEEAWRREEELKYQERVGKEVSIGGEVVHNNPLNDLNQGIATLRQMHITYLNSIYDKNVLEKWKESTYTGKGAFYGKTGYEYIGAHLGYRFLIKKATVKKQSSDYWLKLMIENVGFANAYFDIEIRLIFKQQEQRIDMKPLDYSLRNLGGGESDCILVQLPHLDYKNIQIWIEFIRCKDLQHILLANEGANEEFYLGQCLYG